SARVVSRCLQPLIWYAKRVNNANDYLTTEQIIEISPAPQRIRYADENCRIFKCVRKNGSA
ncbi:MAG: hypothetical protein E7J78_28530, partial [Pantoea sp.]|nr:hypothetical protein [Pantoea sp.]